MDPFRHLAGTYPCCISWSMSTATVSACLPWLGCLIPGMPPPFFCPDCCGWTGRGRGQGADVGRTFSWYQVAPLGHPESSVWWQPTGSTGIGGQHCGSLLVMLKDSYWPRKAVGSPICTGCIPVGRWQLTHKAWRFWTEASVMG